MAVAKFSLTVSKSTGVCALKNPLVTLVTCFVDEFPVGTDSVFVDFLLVNRSCEHFRIQRVIFGISFVHDFGDGSGSVFSNSF